jgi:Tetracyclin repressor-like, C-terminal domain
VAETLASGLAANPLFCDFLANLHLHLEHEVDLERVVEIRRTSTDAALSLADAIEQALPALGRSGAFDAAVTRLLTATCVGLLSESSEQNYT